MTVVLGGKVSAEGRIVIPADIRNRLGLAAGDRVQFLVDDAGVRLVTARTLAAEVWANNIGGDAADPVDLVREARAASDRESRWDDEPAETPSGSGDDVLAMLFPDA